MKKQNLILIVGILIIVTGVFLVVMKGAKAPNPVASPAQTVGSSEDDIDKDLDKLNPNDFGTDDLNAGSMALDPEVQKDLNEIEKELNSLGDNPFDTSDL